MLLGSYKTSEKMCCTMPTRPEPRVVPKVAMLRALHGDRAAGSPGVSPAPLADTASRAREGLFCTPSEDTPSKFQGSLSCSVHKEKVGILLRYLHLAQAQLFLSQVPYGLIVFRDCFGKKKCIRHLNKYLNKPRPQTNNAGRSWAGGDISSTRRHAPALWLG